MNLTISGHHIEVTPALKEYISEKIEKLAAHFDDLLNAKVILTVEKHKEHDGRKAECTLHLKGVDLFADASNADMHVAIDEMVAKLERQVVRYKEKHKDHSKVGVKHATVS
jgi:putative sigma-54 modulation protein